MRERVSDRGSEANNLPGRQRANYQMLHVDIEVVMFWDELDQILVRVTEKILIRLTLGVTGPVVLVCRGIDLETRWLTELIRC